jgi:hypothetical protein
VSKKLFVIIETRIAALTIPDFIRPPNTPHFRTWVVAMAPFTWAATPAIELMHKSRAESPKWIATMKTIL